MTIKEIEELAEMPRANVRFYEAEGLLTPTRSKNGYRDYSEEDLQVLKKIKLLRSLHMSLEEIKALHTGQEELSVVLEQQIKKLSADKEELDKAQSVCESMYRDGSRYESLDTEKYLMKLKDIPCVAQEDTLYNMEPNWDTKEAKEDILENVQSPGRRFLARLLDQMFYLTMWYCFLMLGLGISAINRNEEAFIVDNFVVLLLVLILEPLQLSLFGTTLGKWILGLHVWHNDDRKLTFKEAFVRTRQVLFYGQALFIPLFQLWRLGKSFLVCAGPENLEWEYDTRLILKDRKLYRNFVYIAAHVMVIGMILVAEILATIPIHRGEVTIPQFCENYNHLREYYGVDSNYVLDEQGKWIKNPKHDGVTVVVFGDDLPPPEFIFETDADGEIQKISFVKENYIEWNTPSEDRHIMSIPQMQMIFATRAFVCAKQEFSHFSFDRDRMTEEINSHEGEDYDFTEAGVKVSCDVEYQGYVYLEEGELLIPRNDGECSFTMKFSMSNQ